ncbi:MAG: hypothetical protein PWQ12_268 [Clostridiales bacterium]|jgi:hypothetical protein|nr:hypothetical protein [Clostridiales bacterium]
MSIFEMVMLLCFGAAWPLSIYKSWTSRSSEGKSLLFLCVILLGYIAGILNKILVNMDWVIILYIINFIMVFTDTMLYFRNVKLQRQNQSHPF